MTEKQWTREPRDLQDNKNQAMKHLESQNVSYWIISTQAASYNDKDGRIG